MAKPNLKPKEKAAHLYASVHSVARKAETWKVDVDWRMEELQHYDMPFQLTRSARESLPHGSPSPAGFQREAVWGWRTVCLQSDLVF